MAGAAGTSVGAVSDAFVAMVEAIPGLAGLDIAYGTDRDPENERLEIGNIANWTQRAAGANSAKRRDEEYDLEVWIVVGRPGDAQAEATTRSMQILALVAMAIRSDPTLGLGTTFDSLITELKPAVEEKGATTEGRASWVKAALHVFARI